MLNRDPQIIARLVSLGSVAVATCVIVRGELVFMAAKSEQRTVNMARVEALLSSLPVYPIDPAAADWYGTLKAALIDRFGPKERAKRRRATLISVGVSENDLWIAALAKSRDLVIVSADTDFARIQEVVDLRVESWLGVVSFAFIRTIAFCSVPLHFISFADIATSIRTCYNGVITASPWCCTCTNHRRFCHKHTGGR